ncbi:hypothetical protein V5R04_15445 [Jonesiaceae bacterium BS-20]|uniref:Nucleotidyltransferase family protein n=1 Tax=Jonesiaceae bacterium BS-20 TaxID=3120821 RepID=A0AAU7DW75_9MICO
MLNLSDGLLPVAKHRASIEEVRRAFVENAPFREQRDRLWNTFLVYRSLILDVIPNARFWVDGGFVTHKEWAAPKDIDVCVLVVQRDLEGVDASFEDLLTREDSAGRRVQPMGGLIDGFLVIRNNRASLQYWHEHWTNVTDQNGDLDPVRRKGYVEVIGE